MFYNLSGFGALKANFKGSEKSQQNSCLVLWNINGIIENAQMASWWCISQTCLDVVQNMNLNKSVINNFLVGDNSYWGESR